MLDAPNVCHAPLRSFTGFERTMTRSDLRKARLTQSAEKVAIRIRVCLQAYRKSETGFGFTPGGKTPEGMHHRGRAALQGRVPVWNERGLQPPWSILCGTLHFSAACLAAAGCRDSIRFWEGNTFARKSPPNAVSKAGRSPISGHDLQIGLNENRQRKERVAASCLSHGALISLVHALSCH